MLNLIFCCLYLFANGGTASATSKDAGTPAENRVKKKITWTYGYSFGGRQNEAPRMDYCEEFDRDGKPTSTHYFNQDGSISNGYKYLYDDKERLTVEYAFNSDTTQERRWDNEYIGDTLALTSCHHQSSNTLSLWKTYYDTNGRERAHLNYNKFALDSLDIQMSTFGSTYSKSPFSVHCDSTNISYKGDTIKFETYAIERTNWRGTIRREYETVVPAKFVEYWEYGQLLKRQANTYDPSGHILSEETYIGTINMLYTRKLFTYDYFGNLLMEEIYDDEQQGAYYKVIYTYTSGLCTKMEEYARGVEEPAFTTEYVYEFYED